MSIFSASIACFFGMTLFFWPLQARDWEIHLPVCASVAQSLSPDHRTLMMGDTFGPVLLFDAGSGVFLHAWEMPCKRQYSLAWMPDGKGVLLGDPDAPDAKALLLRSKNGSVKRLPGGVHAVAPSPSGRYLASICYDTLWLADAKTGQRLRFFEPPFRTWRLALRNIQLLTWLPGDQLLVIRGGYGVGVPSEVQRLDVTHAQMQMPIPLPEGAVACSSAMDPIRHALYVGTEDGRLIHLDLEAGRMVSDRKVGTERIVALSLDAGGRLARWQGMQLLISAPDGHDLAGIPAFRCEETAGWRPLLAWSGEDLIAAGLAEHSIWKAQRKTFVISPFQKTDSSRTQDPGS